MSELSRELKKYQINYKNLLLKTLETCGHKEELMNQNTRESEHV